MFWKPPYSCSNSISQGGEIQETSKKNVLKAIAAQDLLQEVKRLLFFLSLFLYSQEETPQGFFEDAGLG